MRKPFVFVILAIIACLLVYNIFILNGIKTANLAHQPQTTASPQPREQKSLSNVISPIIGSAADNYAIVVENLETGERFSSNEHKLYEAGSLYKLWVMGEVERQISVGDLAEDQVISENASVINAYFGIDPQYAEESDIVSYTVAEALDQMITVSDNYSALLLSKTISPKNLALFAANNGFAETEVGKTNVSMTTAYDAAQFFRKLYNGELVNKGASQKMIDILKRQEINDRIPNKLPKGTIVAHKTGDIDNFTNDAGIVYSPKGDYIIVLLSQTADTHSAGEIMANISEAVYNHFNN